MTLLNSTESSGGKHSFTHLRNSKIFDTKALRGVFGHFATGVTVVTSKGIDEQIIGITANSFSSLSLEPPLVLWSLALKSPNITAFTVGKPFVINILKNEYTDLALKFARPAENKFLGVKYKLSQHEIPLIEDALAHLQCKVAYTHVFGDHLLIVGHVDDLGTSPGNPLLFYQGGFANLAN